MDDADTRRLEPMQDGEIRDVLWQVEPLAEITLQLDGLFDEDEPRLSSLQGVVTTVDRSMTTHRDAVTVEGQSDDLDDNADGFALRLWYDPESGEIETSAVVQSFRYRDNGDRSITQLGELTAVDVGGAVAREDVFDDE